jgi:hypothetical protein
VSGESVDTNAIILEGKTDVHSDQRRNGREVQGRVEGTLKLASITRHGVCKRRKR